jgi:3-dehydroquinate synthase
MLTVSVDLGSRSYLVQIGRGVRTGLPDLLSSLGGTQQIAVVADATVAKLHWDRIAPLLPPGTLRFDVPPGESSKSLATASGLYDALATARFERSDLIVALGGGMVGDLAGFVAATWLRGVRFLQMPTTLEAAVDASVGGKTAVNHPAGKNLIGVFHQPSAVLIDTELLDTLPARDFVAGLAESVKHAAACDPAFFEWHEQAAAGILCREPETLDELITWNCRIKAGIVARDERERDLRAILNFGHTIGHALEHALAFELRHGECVALGMLAENEISRRRGWLAAETNVRVRGLLERLGLPTRLPCAVSAEAVLTACRLDKKVRAGAVHMILLEDLGRPRRAVDVTDEEIAASLLALNSAPDRGPVLP